MKKESRPFIVAQVLSQGRITSHIARLVNASNLFWKLIKPSHSLPFILASCLVEDVVLAVDVENAIFHRALPASGSVIHRHTRAYPRSDAPLVLDTLDLVIHA